MGALSFQHWVLVLVIVAVVIAPGWALSKAKDLGKAKKSFTELTNN